MNLQERPLTVAWISDFPVEWISEMPEELASLPREHPLSWKVVLLHEFEKNPALKLHVVAMKKGLARDFSFQRHGVTFHMVKFKPNTRGTTLHWLDTFKLRPILNRIQPDVVHAWGSEKGAGLVAYRSGFPYILTIQGLLGWYRELLPASRYEKYYAWIEKISLNQARFVSTEANFSRRWLEEKFPHLQVFQIEHAAQWACHQVKRQPALHPIRFVSVGTLCYRKGTDLLLRALNQLVNEFRFEAVLIGDANPDFLNPLLAGLAPETRQRISVKSNCSGAEIASELAQATLFLLPTRADTSPNAVKEAVVAGVPVVASDVGGIPDYVTNDENGFIFKSGDLEHFVTQIRAAVRHPLFSQGQVSASSLARNREYLSPARMAQSFLEAYRVTLGTTAKPR